MQFVVTRSEEFLGEVGRDVRVVVFAREHVQVHCVGLIREVARNERRFNELGHGKPGHALILAEIHDRAFAEPLHSDSVAQFNNKLLNLLRVSDSFRIAPMQINAGVQTPSVDEFVLLTHPLVFLCCVHL